MTWQIIKAHLILQLIELVIVGFFGMFLISVGLAKRKH